MDLLVYHNRHEFYEFVLSLSTYAIPIYILWRFKPFDIFFCWEFKESDIPAATNVVIRLALLHSGSMYNLKIGAGANIIFFLYSPGGNYV